MQWVRLSELTIAVVGTLVGVLLISAVTLWISSDRADRKKEKIWKAIEEWVNLPIARFRYRDDTLPLAEKPPKLAYEIEECLRQKYPSLWNDLQKLRQEYHELKNEDIAKRFTTIRTGIQS